MVNQIQCMGINMSDWISVEDEMPPIFEETRITFLAIWLDSGEIDGIDWYSYDGEHYWNQNSANRNDFGGKNQMRLFSHWMPMLDAPNE